MARIWESLRLEPTDLKTLGDVATGHILGRYELLVPIATGGMAMVWAARMKGTRGFQKIVAIKTMLPAMTEDPLFEQMFLDEAGLASRIRHPNVVETLDLGEEDSVLYLVMEWIDGEPLNMLLREAGRGDGVPLSVGTRIVAQALAGLHAAHELRDDAGELVGVVHRDVSPQNILVTYAGLVKIVDFGIAKAMGRVAAETSAGQVKGKVPYMSPEQAKGGQIDRRTDVFAIGTVLYMLTTGKHPFRGDTEAETLLRITSAEPVIPPSRVARDYPPALESVVQTALAKDPAHRFATAADMLRALDAALPESLRSSTDEEVGAFVRALFADRIAKRKAAIAEALALADERAAGRMSSPDPPTQVLRISETTAPPIDASRLVAPADRSALDGRGAAAAGVRPGAGAGMRTALVAIGAAVVAAAAAVLALRSAPTGPAAAPLALPSAAVASVHADLAAPPDPTVATIESLPLANAAEDGRGTPGAAHAPARGQVAPPAESASPSASAPPAVASAHKPAAPARPFISPVRTPGF